MDLEKNTYQVLENVAQATQKANRSKNSVEVIAVTKYVDSSTAKELVKAGIRHIGENRVDKFLEKYQALKDERVTWHLIGTLQRRKVKDVINYVDYFHALDSVKLAQEINKHGFAIEEIDTILPELEKLENIQIVGLMTMAPIEADEAELNVIFQQAYQLQQRLQRKQLPNMPFTDLSMGMSRDYAIAIANGSTFVRIGTAFFK